MNATVVTGIGVAAPNGVGTEEYWRATLEGRRRRTRSAKRSASIGAWPTDSSDMCFS